MGVYDVGSAMIADVPPCEVRRHIRPTTAEPGGLPRQSKSVVTIRSNESFEVRLETNACSPAVECMNASQLRIYNSHSMSCGSESQGLMFEEDTAHRKRWRFIP